MPLITKIYCGYHEAAIKDYVRRNPDENKRLGRLGGAAKVAESDGSMIVNLMRSKLLGDSTEPGWGIPFVASFTTHEDDNHRNHGMLSQWRGYGGDDGVAIVFDTKKLENLLETEYQRFEYFSCSIADAVYDKEDLDLAGHFPGLFDELRAFSRNSIEGEKNQALHTLINGVSEKLPSAVGRFKHQAFQEEHECRIIVGLSHESHHKELISSGGKSNKAFKKIHHRSGLCGSVPYIKLFEVIGDRNGQNEEIPIARILIGPSRNQWVHLETVRELVCELAGERNIEVQRSEIPYVGTA